MKSRGKREGNKEMQNENKTERIRGEFDKPTEDKTRRTANSKVFALGNGNYRKVVYGKNVHYYNEEEGRFRSIDNTLVPVLAEGEKEISGYENRYNSCKVRLAREAGEENLMSICKGNHKISWALTVVADDESVSLAGGVMAKSRSFHPHSAATIKEKMKEPRKTRKELRVENPSGEALYADAFDGADLQYILEGNTVKENIIVKEKREEYVFSFRIETENLAVSLSEDKKSVVFRSLQDNKEMFRIPQPVMRDAAGEASAKIHYEILPCANKQNVCFFSIVADKDWMNASERVFPVTVDPTLEADERDANFNFVNCKYLTDGGVISDSGIGNLDGVRQRLYVNFDIPDFGKDVLVNSVKFTMEAEAPCPDGFKGLAVHRLANGTNFDFLTWNTQYDADALDLVQFLPDNLLSVDLTEYFENFMYRGKYAEQNEYYLNKGIVIKAVDENLASNNFISLQDNFNLIFDYRINSGMRKNQAYTSNDAGRSGSSQVNLRTGSLTFRHESIAVEGNRFPVHLSLIYNSYAANGGYDLNGWDDPNVSEKYPHVLSNGWKLGYQQFLIPETYIYGRGGIIQRFRYIDGEGVTHYFENTGGAGFDAVFSDEDGLGLSFAIDRIDLIPNDVIVSDAQGNLMYFEKQRLMKVVKRNGDTTTIEYRKDDDIYDIRMYQIAKITFANGTAATFTYNAYDLMTQMTYNGETVRYVYDYYQKLSRIIYPDGKTTEFTYTTDGALASVTDVSGKKISYTYKEEQPFMISKIEESGTFSAIDNDQVTMGIMDGDSLSIEYISKNLVRTIDQKNIVTIYTFDAEGNATAVFENGNSAITTLSPVSDFRYSGRNQAHSISCNVPLSENNLITASSCTVNASATADVQVAYLPGSALTVGKTYVVSGLAKANSATIDEEDVLGEDRTFALRVRVNYGDRTENYYADFDTKNTSWQMSATSFTAEEGVTGVYVYASYKNNINTATFDHIHMTKGRAATTERKLCLRDTPSVYFDAEDIQKTNYKLKVEEEDGSSEDGPEYTHEKSVKFTDVNRMLQELSKSEVITLRALNGRECIAKAYDVSFTLQDGNTYALADLEIKSITKTDTGTVEREQNSQKSYDDNLYCYVPSSLDSTMSDPGPEPPALFRFSDVESISYRKPDGTNASIGKDGDKYITAKDIQNAIYFSKTGQLYISYNDGEAYEPIGYYIWTRINTTKGSFKAGLVSEKYRREIRKTILDGSSQYTQVTLYDEYGQKVYEKDMRGVITDYVYDDHGNLLTETTYDQNNTLNKMITESRYTADGNFISEEVDPRDSSYTTKYTYNSNGLLHHSVTPEGQTTYYTYNQNKDLASMYSEVTSGTTVFDNKNTFSYNRDYLTQVSHNGLTYGFEYNGLGDITEVSVAGQAILRSACVRGETGDETTTVELDEEGEAQNSTVVNKDRYGRITKITRNNVCVLEKEYEDAFEMPYGSAKLKTAIDNSAGIVYTYTYDEDGEVNKVTYTGNRSGSIEREKDSKKRIAKETYTFADTTEELVYTYGYEDYPDDRVNEISLEDHFTQTIFNDKMGRTQSTKLMTPGALELTQSYDYYIKGYSYIGDTTNYVKKLTTCVWVNRALTEYSENYAYDKNGNISSITSAEGSVQYSYDGLNRLVQELNWKTGKSYFYTYDAGGNILTKKVKALATGEVTEQKNYTYDATYKDRLIGFGEESIGGYDLQGRPTNYRGMSLEWTHGRVSKFTKGGFTQTCTYDANGIRTEKIENGKTHKYYVEDSRIVREVVTGSENYELYYLYGANGIAGFTHKTANGSTTYYYRKNLLGDVTAIYDAAGSLQAEYAYDAWGNCTVNSDMGGIAALNPIRYRGYYWDEEIALYYLNARYYDPEVGRFISQDSIKYLAPETLNGINLFAYCLNNPVMETDPDGTFWFTFLTTVIGAIVGAVVGAIDYAVNADGEFDGNEFCKNVVAGAASGATAGFILGITKGTGIKAASYASAAVSSTISEVWDYVAGTKELTVQNVAMSFLQVVGETWIDGSFNYIANLSAAKIVPTNPGWVIPEKFLSYFTKSYGQKMIKQTLISGFISSVINIFMGLISE